MLMFMNDLHVLISKLISKFSCFTSDNLSVLIVLVSKPELELFHIDR